MPSPLKLEQEPSDAFIYVNWARIGSEGELFVFAAGELPSWVDRGEHGWVP